jgi:hypothetical protein
MTKRDFIAAIVGLALAVAWLGLVFLVSGCVTAPKPPPTCEDKVIEIRDQMAATKCAFTDFQTFKGSNETVHLLLVYTCKSALQGFFLINTSDKENIDVAKKTFTALGQCIREDGATIEVFKTLPQPLPKSSFDSSRVSQP